MSLRTAARAGEGELPHVEPSGFWFRRKGSGAGEGGRRGGCQRTVPVVEAKDAQGVARGTSSTHSEMEV